jgi:hypothetical protein
MKDRCEAIKNGERTFKVGDHLQRPANGEDEVEREDGGFVLLLPELPGCWNDCS